MSKRAEAAALEAYPVEMITLHYQELIELFRRTEIDNNKYPRSLFQEGYEQAEKDTIERAIQWLIAHTDDYIVDMEVSRYKPSKLHVGGMCWEHLKKAMEEE